MSPAVRRLGPGLRRAVANNAGPLTLEGSCNYRVGEMRAVLIDPGPADPEQEARIGALTDGARSVETICLTHAHPDHAGGAFRMADRLGASVAASALTLERLGGRSAGRMRVLQDGDTLEVDGGDSELRALASPGHAEDHVCYLWQPGGALFSGDQVLGRGTAMVAHPDGHMGAYLASLERLMSLRPRRIYPGHGPPVEEAVDRLREYVRHRLQREDQIRGAVRAGARDVPGIRRRVYGELPEGLEWAAEASIRAHLRHLEEEGTELPPIAGREAPATGEGH